jgi:hypothetical protein
VPVTDHLLLILWHLKARQAKGYALVKQPVQHVFSPDHLHRLAQLSLTELHVLMSVTDHVCSQLKAAVSHHP